MQTSPKILVLVDEPSLMVDILFELEGRGFDVEPMNPDEQSGFSARDRIDAAVFDLQQPDSLQMAFARRLRKASIPIIALANGALPNTASIAGTQSCLPKPVDYDRLARLLFELTDCRAALAGQPDAGVSESPRQDHQYSPG